MWRRLAPIAGFGIGWAGMTTATSSGLVDPQYLLPLYRMSLKAQLQMWHVVPSSVCGALLAPEEEISNALKAVEAPDGRDEQQKILDQRRSFGEILKECGMQEQVDWLQDHVLEEIPFFYIGDLFHCWASLHESIITTGGKGSSITKKEREALHNELLTSKVLEKMDHGVVPFDVAVRVLCILAVGHEANAKVLASAVSSDGLSTNKLVLTRCSEYAAKRAAEQDPNNPPVVSDVIVAQSVVLLLEQLNKALRQRRLLGILPPKSECPVAVESQKEWCGAEPWLVKALGDDDVVSESFLTLVSRHLKCP